MVNRPLSVPNSSASSSPSFSLSGRFILINNILCKTATNDGAFRPSQLFGSAQVDGGNEEDGILHSSSGSCASAYVMKPRESSFSIQHARRKPQERDETYDDANHHTNHGSMSKKDSYDALARISAVSSLCPSPPPVRQDSHAPPYRSPTDGREWGAAQKEPSFVPYAYSPLGSPDASRREVEDRAENRSVAPNTSSSTNPLYSPAFFHDVGGWRAEKDIGRQPLASWPRSSPPTPPRTKVAVVSNPNCLILRLFGITSGGVLLDSFGRTATDMLDTALLCSSAIQERFLSDAERCSPPPPFIVSSRTVGSAKQVAPGASSGVWSTPFFSRCTPSPVAKKRTRSSKEVVQPQRGKRKREESERKEEEEGEDEENAAANPPFLPSLFSDVASCLPAPFHASLSLDTVPARNLLLYAEGNFEDVVAEAHYCFLSSIEPLHFQGTSTTPLCFPRGGESSRDRSTRRHGEVSCAAQCIWGRLCVLENAPLLYYVPRADATHREEKEEEKKQGSKEAAAARTVPSSTEDRYMQCLMWKRWIGELELLRRWSKALQFNCADTLGTSFQVWITPHNLYPQLAGHRVRLVLPWRIDEEHGTQNYFPVFHANELGIHGRRHLKHGYRSTLSSRYWLLRAVTREFRLTRKELQKTSHPSRVRFSSPSRPPLSSEHDGRKDMFLPESMCLQEFSLGDTDSPFMPSHSSALYAVGDHSNTMSSLENEGPWGFPSPCSFHHSMASMERTMPTRTEKRRDENKKVRKGIQFLPGGEIGVRDSPTQVRDYWLLFHRFYPSLDIEKVPLQKQRSSASNVPSQAEENPRKSALWNAREDEKKTAREAQEVSYAPSRSSSVGNASNDEWSKEPHVIYRFTSSKKSFSCARTIHRYYERYGKYLSSRYRPCSFSSSVSGFKDDFISNENEKNKKDTPLSSSSAAKKMNSVSESEVAGAWHYLLLNDEEMLFHRLKRLSNYLVTLMEYDYGLI